MVKSDARRAFKYIQWPRDVADDLSDGNSLPSESHDGERDAEMLRQVASQMDYLLTDLQDAVDNWIRPQLDRKKTESERRLRYYSRGEGGN